MPIFEYKCQDCNAKFEVLHKSASNPEKVVCPECDSENYKKLLSSFSSPVSAGVDFAPSCSNGSCGGHASPCADGMCGIN
jgi:putative FmdB family regulatory protein